MRRKWILDTNSYNINSRKYLLHWTEKQKSQKNLKPLSVVSKETFFFSILASKHNRVLFLKLFLDTRWCIFYIKFKISHHHHIALVARISLTLSRHSSLSFITLGRSSGQHPVSSHSCWMYVWAGRPAFAWPCVGIHKSTSLMSSSLLLQQCPACLVRLTWIVFVIGGRWPNSWCLVGCCCQDAACNPEQVKISTEHYYI